MSRSSMSRIVTFPRDFPCAVQTRTVPEEISDRLKIAGPSTCVGVGARLNRVAGAFFAHHRAS